MTQSRVTELMTGRNFDSAVIATDHDDAPVVLSVRNLTRNGEFSNVSFELRRGETLGITGLLGAGRTELALTLFGMHKPHSGEILLEGEKSTSVPTGTQSAQASPIFPKTAFPLASTSRNRLQIIS